MTAQYAHLGGRRYVNADFVSAVREAFPATTKKIPLGYSTYTGWTGKDEILFVEQGDTAPDVDFLGTVFQVSFDASNPDCFEKDILKKVKHTVLSKEASTPEELEMRWGKTVADRIAKEAASKEAGKAGGLYGYPRGIQASCDIAARRLNRKAAVLMAKAMAKDDTVVGFLNTHAKRANSLSARVLLGAYGQERPSIIADSFFEEPEDQGLPHMASARYGAYGYPAKTAKLGLSACTALREAAGHIAAGLHARRAALHPRITGFLGEHAKTARCGASRLILSCYPEPGFSCKQASMGWGLDWDSSGSE